MNRDNYYCTILLLACLSTSQAMAEEASTASISGSVTATAQTSNDSKVSDETQASADLVGVLPVGPGDVNIHVEGSTTTGDDGIAALIGETNGDVGSALNKHGNGRIQISEFFYSLSIGGPTLGIGLLDPSANLDTDAIANDENTQFLANPLINNPTIDFPDYTLGLTLDSEPETAGLGYHFFIGSSHGLGDNDSRDYSDLFDIDDSGKGVFAAGEGVWKTPALTARVGLWLNTRDHQRLDGTKNSDNKGLGLYGGLNGSLGAGTWSLRASVADSSVSEAAWSLGLATEYPINEATNAGLGLTHTAASGKLDEGSTDTMVAEAYVRFTLDKHLQLSPLIQYVRNPDFGRATNADGEALDEDQWLLGLRLHAPF